MERLNDITYAILTSYGEYGIALAAVILLLFVVQAVYHLGIYNRIAGFRLGSLTKRRDEAPAVSIVVPIFTEDINYLDNGLLKLLTQECDNYEVVAVYIGNDDGFYADLCHLKSRYPHLSPVHIDSSPHYPVTSKTALNVGIKSAHNEHVLLTTIDATPASKRWVALMAKGFQYGDVVLGYCGIDEQPGFKNFIFREYRFSNSVAWLSAAIRHKTYCASRHNMGFTKSLYFDVRGFNYLNMGVGEDDLFVQRIATHDNVSVVLSPRVACYERTWGGWRWWMERVHRYGATHRYYPLGAKVTVALELLSRTAFFAAAITAIATMPWEYATAAAVVVLLRYFMVMFAFIRTARRLGETTLTARHALYDLGEPLLRLIIALSQPGNNRNQW
ncbi:MAG: glycosyltransferase [Alistipes sp.]|nr:glycosyltransferase [Alistipes sp.]